MSNTNENHGYAVEGKLMESTKGYLVLWTINAGSIRYADLVNVAKSNNMTQGKIPKLRSAKNAFAKAKDAIPNSPLPVLLELAGWDGAVKQSIDVKPLKRSNEYQVSIRRDGRMHGKLHSESTPVFRLVFSPPDTFDHTAWVQNYMRSFWDEAYIKQIESGEVERPLPSQTLCCIRIEGYWTETEIDIDLMSQIQSRISEAFQNTITSIDETLLRQHIKETLVSLGGVNFLAGKGVTYVPKTVNVKDTLDSVANIIASFARGYDTSVNNENYYNEDGNPVNHYGTKSNFRYLGYLDGAREMQYIREDLGSNLSKDIIEFQAKVTKHAGNFNAEKVKLFAAGTKKLLVEKRGISKRLQNAEKIFGGTIPIKRKMYVDVSQRLTGRLRNISTDHTKVTNTLLGLVDFTN
jgi:hypothetical protein